MSQTDLPPSFWGYESVQGKSGHSVYWDLLKEIEKVKVWIMDDFPVPDP